MTYYQTRLCLGPFPCLVQKSSHIIHVCSVVVPDSIRSQVSYNGSLHGSWMALLSRTSLQIYMFKIMFKNVFKKMCWVLSQSKMALLPWLGGFRCSSLTAIVIGRICAAAPTDGASRTCRRTTSTTLDRGAMTVSVVLGASVGCPLQHMEKVAATGMVLVLDVGC